MYLLPWMLTSELQPTSLVRLCARYLGLGPRLLNFNYLPIPVQPFIMGTVDDTHPTRADPFDNAIVAERVADEL